MIQTSILNNQLEHYYNNIKKVALKKLDSWQVMVRERVNLAQN